MVHIYDNCKKFTNNSEPIGTITYQFYSAGIKIWRQKYLDWISLYFVLGVCNIILHDESAISLTHEIPTKINITLICKIGACLNCVRTNNMGFYNIL